MQFISSRAGNPSPGRFLDPGYIPRVVQMPVGQQYPLNPEPLPSFPGQCLLQQMPSKYKPPVNQVEPVFLPQDVEIQRRGTDLNQVFHTKL